MLNEVTAALAAIEAEGAFATVLACGSDDLRIEVKGVGPIRFPISATMARRLCAVARAAPFGRRGETLHDVAVRDTWEIASRQISIDARRWRRTLDPELAVIRRRLGLPEGGQLEVTLDKMLVYGPGQFFAPHQDSERADDMVGSLVVDLPSMHEGGALVVHHQGKMKVLRRTARGAKELSLFAFYADCRHEVRPVVSGYRVTLAYQLLHRTSARGRAPLPPASAQRLSTAVKAYFSTPVPMPYSRSAPERPERLTYLLDHEYTRKSLAWHRLKSADRLRAEALRQVAERLDCEVYLALADVHENWSCDGDDDWGGRYGRRGRHRRDEDSDGDDAEDHELLELLDTGVELRHWVGMDGRSAPGFSARPASGEICFTRPSAEMTPFKSEHEGYMGNYGNTVDRWYHRAAVVMWPRARNFAIRARMSPSWAIKEVASLIKRRAANEARDRARELLPFWNRSVPEKSTAAFVRQLLTVVGSLNDADLALELLSPLGPHRLSPTATPAFIALVERYGFSWSQRVFGAWSGDTHYDTPPWLSSLPRLSEALAAGGKDGKALAAWLLARETASFKETYTLEAFVVPGLQEVADRLQGDLVALLETAAGLRSPSVRDDVLAFLMAPKTALPLMSAGALLQTCLDARTPGAVRALGLTPLYRHVVSSLEGVLGTPARSSDDWSIEPPAGCTCDLCRELSAFLRDRRRIRLEWPLAKERRRHIHSAIDRHRLPVTHATVRSGSPQTLVLTKQKELFQRASALRARQKTLLAWLRKRARAFGNS